MTKARDLANAGTALTTVSATELGYLDGVTSAVQTQINTKAPSVSPTLTTPTVTNGFLSTSTIRSPKETMQFFASGFNGVFNADTNSASFVINNSNATGNFSINFRANPTATFDSIISPGQSFTYSLLNTNGTTAYYLTGITIDGVTQTVKWSGGTAPSAGNASAIDAYSFTIIKTASATYTVLGAGPIKYA